MKAEITLSQVWWNPSILRFFFRQQAEETLAELIEKSADTTDKVLNAVEDYANEKDLDIDSIEEMFYEDCVFDLADEFGVELIEEEDE